MQAIGGIQLSQRWDECMQKFCFNSRADAFDILINDTIGSQNQSADAEPPIFDSQTPLSDQKIFPEIPLSDYDDSTGTNLPVKADASASDTNENELCIPLEVETMAILASMLEDEAFDTGVSNASEKYFKKLFDENRVSAMNGISTLFMNNYSVQGRKINILIGILHILSHFEYTLVYPQGQMIAICALSHSSREVEEFGIKCFENWDHKDGIAKLKSVKFNSEWLQDYAEEVINELSVGD